MKNDSLSTDLLFYDITIRALAIVATVLFSLLFFQGAEASKQTEWKKDLTAKNNTEVIAYTK
ncbi:MAG: hypothetical protein NTY88_10215 [Bacteroidetes bacterium]|nr:hypothetical protein [Bacteroidota bacterium]